MQLIVFPADPVAALQRDWWQGLTHRPAEDARRRPIDRFESGRYNDLNLAVATDLQKISWMISAEVRPDTMPEVLPAIGSYPIVRDRFVAMLTPWLAGSCPLVNRIGFAGAIVQPAADHEAAYRRLGEYLSTTVQVDPRSTDFNYRVNRPRTPDLDIPGLTINCLSTWSALNVQSSFRAVLPHGIQHSVALRLDLYACMMQFDINTSANREQPLSQEVLPDLFRELISKATEVAEQGDRPS